MKNVIKNKGLKTPLKKAVALVLTFVCVCALAACGNGTSSKEAETSEFPTPSYTIDTWPRIDGATGSVPYYEAVAARLLNMDIEDARQYVYENNTPAAFQELSDGEVDLIFCLYASEEQEEYANSQGVYFEYVPYANEAFVFFVNKDNPVDSLTIQQLHDIYSGKITNWKEVGGDDEPITAYQRNEGSGSQTGLYQFVIGEDEVMEPKTEERIGSMGEIIDAVATYDNSKGALGYSYLYFITNQHYDDSIKLLKIEGFEPNKENVVSGDYPMITQKCIVFNAAEPEDSDARIIAAWCVSEEGQKLAEELSYMPVKIY